MRASKNKQSFSLVGAGTLSLTLLEATNLPMLASRCDSFCKVTTNFTSQVFHTHTKKKTVTPVWEQCFPIYVGKLEPDQQIIIYVFDKTIVGHDLLGEITLKLTTLLSEQNHYTIEDWFTLLNEPVKIKNKDKSGPAQLKLSLNYIPPGPNATIFASDPEKEYRFERILGKGAFGTVRKAILKTTGEVYAAKIISKKNMKPENRTLLEREVHLMSRLHHPNIVQFEACYDTSKHVVLILEFVSGGELFQDILSRTEPYYEKDAAVIVRQLFTALEYMHSLGIAHRDLKPENLLLTGDKKTIKITDFGFSKDTGDTLKTACGTALYVAPEVLTEAQYDTSCDVWSLGVITYVLLSAHVPFNGATEQEIFSKILSVQYTFPPQLFESVSPVGKDFIQKIFVADPKKRMTATDCLHHPWLTEDSKCHSTAELTSFRSKIAKFHESQRALKRPQNQLDEEHDDDDVV